MPVNTDGRYDAGTLTGAQATLRASAKLRAAAAEAQRKTGRKGRPGELSSAESILAAGRKGSEYTR